MRSNKGAVYGERQYSFSFNIVSFISHRHKKELEGHQDGHRKNNEYYCAFFHILISPNYYINESHINEFSYHRTGS